MSAIIVETSGIAMKSLQTSQASQEKKSFEELQLKNDRIELTLLPEFGCHWTRMRFSLKGNWLDFLVGAPDHEALLRRPAGYGSYMLAPWSNRIAGAAFELDGQRHQLRENFPDGTAIHGDVRTRPWKVIVSRPERFEASLDSREHSDFNFPFSFFYRHVLELSEERLRVELSIENVDRVRAPAGIGFHPFLRRRLTRLDRDVILVVPAERVYPAEACLPTGDPQPVSGRTDLRHLKFLGKPGLDHCFTGLKQSEFRIIYPGTRVEVRFNMDPAFTHAVIYAPNDPDGKPREFVAVEPVTHANDGFNLLARGWKDTGVKILEPGERWGASWEISVGDI
jgi:aldose 1-epimerase